MREILGVFQPFLGIFEKTKEKKDRVSGPNRAMQPRCAMRFESHTPKSLAMRKSLFFVASDARTHSLAIRTPAEAWPAMRAPAMPKR